MRALAERDGVAPLVTTATPTGARELERRAPPGTRHRYLPIDVPGAVHRFLDAERPRCAGIVETEIWPWLYASTTARDVPLTIVSARLSARTLDGPARALASTYRRALAGVRVLARSADDAERWRRLAGPGAQVEDGGDLKAVPPPDGPPPVRPLARAYALAASTHADEEVRLAAAWAAAVRVTRSRDDAAPPLLVIAPRHAARGAELARALAGSVPPGTGVSRRSTGASPAPEDALYLADTLGEMQAWYACAEAAFVGGSLVPRGGHNLLEPARAGVPIVTGPHTANFARAAAALAAADALRVVPDARGAAAFLHAAVSGDAATLARGARGRRVAETLDADGALTLERCLRALA